MVAFSKKHQFDSNIPYRFGFLRRRQQTLNVFTSAEHPEDRSPFSPLLLHLPAFGYITAVPARAFSRLTAKFENSTMVNRAIEWNILDVMNHLIGI